MKKQTIVTMSLAVLIIGCWSITYFWGTPWDRINAINSAKLYASARNYAFYDVTDCKFDYKNRMYVLHVSSEEENTVSYNLRISADGKDIYVLDSYTK